MIVKQTSVTLTSANTEYSIDLSGATFFSFQCRTAVDTRYAFVAGKVAGSTDPYGTLKSGTVYGSPMRVRESIDNGTTLYLANASAGSVVEVQIWY